MNMPHNHCHRATAHLQLNLLLLLLFTIKSFPILKYSFFRPLFRPLDYAARADRATRPTLATPLATIKILKKEALM
jgi:hypothetical protein